MALSKKYMTQSEAIISYDFTDMIVGVAYKTYYLGAAHGNGNILTSSVIGSDGAGFVEGAATKGIVSYDAGGNGADTLVEVFNQDYTFTFTVPATIEGELVCSFSHGLGGAAADPSTCSIKTKVVIEKNGTPIVNEETTEIDLIPGFTGGEDSLPGAIALTMPKTHFAIGDTLTVNVIGFSKSGVATRAIFYGIGTDPEGRDNLYQAHKVIEDGQGTAFKVHIPFKPDL